jgi:hypothetical protein
MYKSVAEPLKVYGNAMVEAGTNPFLKIVQKAAPAALKTVGQFLSQVKNKSPRDLRQMVKEILEGKMPAGLAFKDAGMLTKALLGLVVTGLLAMANAGERKGLVPITFEKGDTAGVTTVVEQIPSSDFSLAIKIDPTRVLKQQQMEQEKVPQTETTKFPKIPTPGVQG